MYAALPVGRPPKLRRRSIAAGAELWRIDSTAGKNWGRDSYPTPSHRFDSAAGAFRTRYAGSSIPGAARERYLAAGRYIPDDHNDHYLVRLRATRPLSVLDLRTEANLDALDVDDRISTSHEPAVWDACHQLADRARDWWDDLHGIVFRSRTTPTTAYNLAFFATAEFELDSRPLATCAAELDDLVVRHQFTIGFDY